MAYRWARSGQTIVSTCQACSTVLTSRHEPSLLVTQRGHQGDTCQQIRDENDAAIIARRTSRITDLRQEKEAS